MVKTVEKSFSLFSVPSPQSFTEIEMGRSFLFISPVVSGVFQPVSVFTDQFLFPEMHLFLGGLPALPPAFLPSLSVMDGRLLSPCHATWC